MHTLPGARVGALPAAHGGTNTTGPLHAVPSWSTPSHSSSSHAAAHRRLVQHSGTAQTALHAALPKIGIVAVPDESLATARLSQQSQQQQSAPAQRRLQVRRTRVVPQIQQQQEDYQQPTELLTDLQRASQQQQQALWQAQATQQPPQYQGRQPTGSAQYQNNRSNQQSAPRSPRHPADSPQHEQYQPRPAQQQTIRSYQLDQSSDWYAPQQGQQRPVQQQQQQQQHQQRQGQGYQARPQQQKPHQQQQQSGGRWQGGSGQSDKGYQRSQQSDWQPQQQQRQQQDRRPDQRQSDDEPADSSSSNSQLRFSYGLKQDWSLPTGMAVTYLGSSSGSPTRDRNVSCTVLRLPESLYLVDCGEGSSRQAKLTGMQLEQVETLFITHLHGDHCFGIGTMLVAMCKARKAAAAAAAADSTSSNASAELAGPEDVSALRVFGPPRVGELIASMLYIAGVGRQLDQPLYITEFVETESEAHDWEPLPLPVSVSATSSIASSCSAFIRRMAPTQELPMQAWPAGLARRLDRTGLQWQESNRRQFSPWFAKAGLLWQIPCRQVTVTAAQLQHRVPCWGYVFEENVQPTTPTSNSSNSSSSSSSSGSGSGSSSSSGSSARGRRVVLLGDTVDSRPIAPIALGADLVSHEATFAAGMETKAAMAQHSTAWMAGQFAWAIQAKALVLTHFSARYEGNKEKSKWLPQGGYEGRRGRADEADSEERTIKALQREADDQYGLGPVLLAIDLLTAHVPKQEGADAS